MSALAGFLLFNTPSTGGASAPAAGTLDLGHAINASLVFAIGSHPAGDDLGTEEISGTALTLMGTSAFDGAHPDDGTRSGLHVRNTSGDGAYIAETAGWATIDTVWSIWADVTVQSTLGAWAWLINQPMGTGAPGADGLYERLGSMHNDTSDAAWVSFHTDATNGYTGAAGSFPNTAGRRRYCATKSGTTSKFYVNGAQVGTDVTVDGASLAAGDLDVTVGNFSRYTTTTQFNAIYHDLRVWTRQLPDADVASLETAFLGRNP